MSEQDDTDKKAAKPAAPAAAPAKAAAPAARPKPKAVASPPKPAEPRGVVIEHPAAGRNAAQAKPRWRHRIAAITFLLAVILPTLAAMGYLWTRAADQYASTTAFSVRGAEAMPALSFLGALSQSVGVGQTDAEIVYEFIRSQQMVEAAAAALPLREMFNRAEDDFVFRLGENRSIEDLVSYWNDMVSVSFVGSSGLVHVEARAFDPASAQAIAQFVLDESTKIVNRLSEEANAEAVRVSSRVLADSEDRLRDNRRSIREFRNERREVDPTDNARATLALIASLRSRLAEVEVERENYLALVGPRGPRGPVLAQEIQSLEQRIEQERARLGSGAEAAVALEAGAEPRIADVVGDYEELAVELEFAQNAYASALAAHEQALVEARRQSRFLSPHVSPTLSVEAQYPNRPFIALAVFVVLLVVWSVAALIAWNVRDRR